MWFDKLFGRRKDDSEPAEHPPQAAAPTPKTALATVRLATDKVSSQPRAKTPKKGFDPYNSGTFDRNQAWERVIR
jgi:hypothetical protein